MTQDDQQTPERGPEGRISRDTLLLLGALTFLILAVALTFLFTPNTGTNVGQTPPTATPAPATEVVQSPVAPLATPTSLSETPYPGPGVIGQARTATPPLPTAQQRTATASPAAPEEPYPGPVGEGTPPPLPTFNPTVITPTAPPPPTRPPEVIQPSPTLPPIQPPPTVPPTPTSDLALEVTPTAVPTVPPATPTTPPPPPADVLRGSVRWSAAQGPIILRRDVQIAPGAELLIEPGVEVRLDPGVSIYVDGGRLLAAGTADRPVRFVGNTGARWSGLFGRPDSVLVLEHTEVRGGGVGGTVMAVDRSNLTVRNSRFTDNGGGIITTDTRLEMSDTQMFGNDIPFGAALEVSFARGNFVTLTRNRFGGNRLSDGSPQVRLNNSSTFETLNLTIDGNLMTGGTPNLQLTTNGPLRGAVVCNTLVGDDQGFGIRTTTEQVAPNGALPMDLRVEQNYIDDHVPPIIPTYLRFGLGRGATSEIFLDMRNNWWGDPSGPYDPERNADGRGDSVGVNIEFIPWLQAPPSCAPPR
ncbi:MAG: hypothetical protein N2378_02445 [Chloroflexaceae bacterium]|nr:hypothetical protein [Chloroflexaceae bacterium]